MKRPWLAPLGPLYGLGVAWKNRGFDQHTSPVQRLTNPVVSVGSLSAGGAGKTPFVIALGTALRNAGIGIDVLSRGHGRSTSETLRVLPMGSALEFGDEPLLLVQRLLCPVYVARERFDAGTRAERERRQAREDKRLSIHLLDDGFQHRRLARAVDIVLLTLEDGQDALLPAGNLREALRSLHRADVIAIRDDESAALEPVLEEVFQGRHKPPVWTIRRRFAFVDGAPSSRPLAFCGIARPDGFRSALRAVGTVPTAILALRDHQRYDEALMRRLVDQALNCGADGFVTTAKDAVKLTPVLRRLLAELGPLAVGDIMVELEDAPRRVAELIAMIESWWKRS